MLSKATNIGSRTVLSIVMKTIGVLLLSAFGVGGAGEAERIHLHEANS